MVSMFRGGEFIKGPIPAFWVARAGKLRRSALVVGIALWMIQGLRRTKDLQDPDGFRVNAESVARDWSLSRRSVIRALHDLERATLIHVTRRPGRTPRVQI